MMFDINRRKRRIKKKKGKKKRKREEGEGEKKRVKIRFWNGAVGDEEGDIRPCLLDVFS